MNAGYLWGFAADIRNAFRAANALVALRNTHLPHSVIQNNLYYEERQLIHDRRREVAAGHYYSDDMPYAMEGPRGLIQGAASSSIVFALLLNDLADELPQSVRLFVYGDDILLLAQSRDECAAAAAILGRCITAHPSGPFQLRSDRPVFANMGFERVGYSYELDRNTVRVEVGPDNRATEKLHDRLRPLIAMNVRLGLRPQTGAAVAIRRFARHSVVSNPEKLIAATNAWSRSEADEIATHVALEAR
jgi:hypothetical protein